MCSGVSDLLDGNSVSNKSIVLAMHRDSETNLVVLSPAVSVLKIRIKLLFDLVKHLEFFVNCIL